VDGKIYIPVTRIKTKVRYLQELQPPMRISLLEGTMRRPISVG